MSIKPLPEDVVAQIKSSAVITSLNSVVLGLVRNALDAEATKVNVSVDFSRANCSIEDNGLGINPTEFSQTGNLGKPYCTSKYPRSPDVLGKHGTFLSSVASLSLLTITSHHHLYNSHNSLSIHDSQVIARQTPALPDQRVLTFHHGTRVVVRDLFGRMPVRVKQRALNAEKTGFGKEWDSLVMSMMALLLACPKPVIILVRNATSHQTMSLKNSGSKYAQEELASKLPDHILRTTSLLNQAFLNDFVDGKQWVSVGASSAQLRLEGCVALEPAATKRIQFINVGMEPLLNDGNANVLFEEINRLFANSDFGVTEELVAFENPVRVRKMGGLGDKEPRTRKGVDRWPMFSLSIALESSPADRAHTTDDILDGREQSLAGLLDLITAMFHEFLKKHHFRPRVLSRNSSRDIAMPSIGASLTRLNANGDETRPTDHDSTIPAPKTKESRQVQLLSRSHSAPSRRSGRSSRSESPFAMWARVKSGHSQGNQSRSESDSAPPSKKSRTEVDQDDSNPKKTRSLEPRRYVAPSGYLLGRPFADRTFTAPVDACSPPGGNVSWTDPQSKTKSIVDTRTGFVVRSGAKHQRITVARVDSKESATDKPRSPSTDKTPAWLTDIRSTWKNPVFEACETPIPRLTESTCGLGSGSVISLGPYFETNGVGDQTPTYVEKHISKDALRRAVVVSQVDQKFILIKIPTEASLNGRRATKSDLLVLVDQHAADERYRVEALMKEYFSLVGGPDETAWTARTEALQRPLVFELPQQEGKLLIRTQDYFRKWGIIYEVGAEAVKTARESNTRIVTLTIHRLPPSILERCRTEPKLLIEIIRRQVWKLEEDQEMAQPNIGNQSSWISRFHGCPDGILDMIHSRSCRSAIMFNDQLSLEQCEQVLERLGQCSFPFQCAHGRPSMVPIVQLGVAEPLDPFPLGNDESAGGFARDFKQWEQRRAKGGYRYR